MLLGGVVNFLLIDLFMKYYGDDFSGKIGSAYHYLGVSIAVITTSFAQVYYSKLSTIESKEELRKNYTFWFLRLFLIAVIGVIIMQFIPNTWDELILGKAWNGTLEDYENNVNLDGNNVRLLFPILHLYKARTSKRNATF